MRVKFFPESFHLDEVIKHRLRTLFEIIDGRTNSRDANPIDLREPFLKVSPNIKAILMKH
jgi:hypothetical protein